MNHKRKVLGASAAVAAIALAHVPTVNAAAGVPFTNSAVDRVQVYGSDTTFTLMNDLGVAYMESDGCLLTAASFPLTAASPTQNRCQSGAGAAIVGDNIFENYDHDTIVNFFPQGSNAGRGQLCNQRSAADGGTDKDPRVPVVDMARSSSAPTTGFQCTVANGGETGSVLRFVAFARDAVTWTHWATIGGAPSNTGGASVVNLTQAQLNDIFVDCTITDWGQVGGEAGKPINVFTSIPGSGTRSTWDGFVGGNSQNCIPAVFRDGSFANGERLLREHQMEPVEAALNDAAAADETNSIYYMSTGLHASQPGLRASSLIGAVNGVVANATTVVDGTFPFARNLFNVYRNAGPQPRASGAVQRFAGMNANGAANPQGIGWICKGEAFHSEPLNTASPVGIEDATANRDWFEEKKAAFAENGIFQLAADAAGHRCTFTDVVTP